MPAAGTEGSSVLLALVLIIVIKSCNFEVLSCQPPAVHVCDRLLVHFLRGFCLDILNYLIAILVDPNADQESNHISIYIF